MTTSISRQFAQWVTELRFEDLPVEVVGKIKALTLLHLLASEFGANHPHAKSLIEIVKSEEPKPDGGTILVEGSRVTRGGAVLANCEVANIAGLRDSYRMITHPGAVHIAVGLTGAELGDKSGKDLITALAAGYEVHCRMAYDFVPAMSAHGFRPAPIFATLGAAVIAGKLLDLDEDQMTTTIALAASSASGLNEPGRVFANERDLQEPNAARQGVFAAVMSMVKGTQGAETSIEGDAGFYAAFAGSRDGHLSYVFNGPRKIDLGSIVERLGQRFRVLDMMFRIYNVQGFNQPVLELITELMQDDRFDLEEVEEVLIYMNYLETTYPSPEFPQADNSRARIGSTHFFAAHGFVNGGYPVVGGKTFGPAGVDLEKDPAVIKFMKEKIRLVGVHDQEMFSPSIEIRMKSGISISGDYPYARMAWLFDEAVEQMKRCAAELPGGDAHYRDLVALCRDIDSFDSVQPIFQAMV